MSSSSTQPPVYYNENAPFPAQWLRELCAVGAIPAGRVDERSVREVRPADVVDFDICHFFGGIGVWSYALEQSGWPLSGLRTWTASLPCQPYSQAGNRQGLKDSRNLWLTFFQLVEQCQPSVLLGEQVASKDGLAWLDVVQADLEKTGYAVSAVDTCAAGFGAPQTRQRLYWVAAWMADATHIKRQLLGRGREEKVRWQEPPRDRRAPGAPRSTAGYWGDALFVRCLDGHERALGPGLRTLAHGSPHAVESLRGFGNALNAEAAIGFAVAAREALALDH